MLLKNDYSNLTCSKIDGRLIDIINCDNSTNHRKLEEFVAAGSQTIWIMDA
jgi:hypothetical protein